MSLLSLGYNNARAMELAAPTPPTTRWYKLYWSGIHVADLFASMNNNKLDAIIESYGIVRRISKFSSRTHAEYNFSEGTYTPRKFYTEISKRHGRRTINISYDDNGVIQSEAVNPPDKRWKRPAVNDDLKIGTLDPLTAFLKARAMVKYHLDRGINTFSFNIYDGRRLSKLDFTIHGRMKETISWTDYSVVKATFKRIPLKGFTKNELKHMEGEEPVVTIYFSDDEHFLPIKADADAPLGTAVLLFEKECTSIKACSSYDLARTQ